MDWFFVHCFHAAVRIGEQVFAASVGAVLRHHFAVFELAMVLSQHCSSVFHVLWFVDWASWLALNDVLLTRIWGRYDTWTCWRNRIHPHLLLIYRHFFLGFPPYVALIATSWRPHSVLSSIGHEVVDSAHNSRNTLHELVDLDVLGKNLEQILTHIVFPSRLDQVASSVTISVTSVETSISHKRRLPFFYWSRALAFSNFLNFLRVHVKWWIVPDDS